MNYSSLRNPEPSNLKKNKEFFLYIYSANVPFQYAHLAEVRLKEKI
jgi:hypothetical protein